MGPIRLNDCSLSELHHRLLSKGGVARRTWRLAAIAFFFKLMINLQRNYGISSKRNYAVYPKLEQVSKSILIFDIGTADKPYKAQVF